MTAHERPRVTVLGEHGTVGLDVVDRLQKIPGIEIIPSGNVKEIEQQLELVAREEVDLVVLCLPDDAAKNFVNVVNALGIEVPKVLDAGTAHRTTLGSVYGFPQMAEGQAHEIMNADLVSNPGCYATGAIALIRPLVEAKVLPPDYPLVIDGISGYTGGGKALIQKYESPGAPAAQSYKQIGHKHLPEIEKYGKLKRSPVFTPTVSNFPRGMLVRIGLHLNNLNGKVSGDDLVDILKTKYKRHERIVQVIAHPPGDDATLDPAAAAGSDTIELHVFWDALQNHVVLIARLDNLGKGASGAAVENIHLMLGLDKKRGA